MVNNKIKYCQFLFPNARRNIVLIIIMKTTNTNQKGYKRGDLINIRLFDRKNTTSKEVDDYFNMKIYQPLYSSFHNYYNVSGTSNEPSYLSCLNTNNGYLLQENADANSEPKRLL